MSNMELIKKLAREAELEAVMSVDLDSEPLLRFASLVAEEIASRIEAHKTEPQVMVVHKITDSPRDIAIAECAAIARIVGGN